MAIKTKKISELGQIEVADIDILKKGDFYFLGSMGGVTGKVSTSDVVNAIRANVEAISKDTVIAYDNPKQSTEISKIAERVTNLEVKIEEISKITGRVTNLEVKIEEISKKIDESIAKLTEKVAALEGFVQALQAEGYLTLANIKKAAADACPICTHTHEEEQPTE
jgi:hypothetical protein